MPWNIHAAFPSQLKQDKLGGCHQLSYQIYGKIYKIMQDSVPTHQIFRFSLTYSFWHLLNTVYCICYHNYVPLSGIQFKSLPLAVEWVWKCYNLTYFLVLFIPRRWHSEGALKVTRRKCLLFSMSWPPGTVRSWLMMPGPRLQPSPQHRPGQARVMYPFMCTQIWGPGSIVSSKRIYYIRFIPESSCGFSFIRQTQDRFRWVSYPTKKKKKILSLGKHLSPSDSK